VSARPFDRLHPAVQYHVVNSLGWQTLRPVQEAAIDPVLSGTHCLVLAPTAGGKTEAAIMPVLSRMLAEDWTGLGVLYVCPIKALLNNLEERLSRYAALVGRRLQVWHGDVSQSAKARALGEPPDILLTTPESLEGMLISRRIERETWFGSLRVAIVDELHAFAGDDRGWHLRAVLDRLDAYPARPMQRIGLSATLGNPDALLRWLAGTDDGAVVGEAAPSADADVTIDHVGSLANAATVVSRLHRGSKRLVFCDSRARVEALASRLRELGTRTFVSHSSLSAAERRLAEQAFAEERDCVIVATSTLELGIDVGDLDYVIQIDAPTTVSSFLQRMGRTGRRAGGRRNHLFLATSDEALLIACAVARLWREACVEPVIPPSQPWHLVAQQAMALILQRGTMGRAACLRELARLFRELDAEGIGAVIEHMLATGILWVEREMLGLGARGEKLYGGKNFLALLSAFDSPIQFLVRSGASELGYVDPVLLRSEDDGKPQVLLLAGRSWRVTAVEFARRTIWVEPARERGRARWFGSSRSLSFALCQAVKRVATDGETGGKLSRRAATRLEELRASLPDCGAEGATIEHLDDARSRWWTFGGASANGVLAAALQAHKRGVQFDDFSIETTGALASGDLAGLLGDFDIAGLAIALAASGRVAIKFSDCLPSGALAAMVRERTLDLAAARHVVGEAQACRGLSRLHEGRWLPLTR
jgi:ATP-dependent Lhr-like helicase